MPSRNNSLPGEEQSVVYPDGSALLRPLDPPRSLKAKMFVPVVAACLIGGAVFFGYANAVIGEPQRQQEALQENITRDVALDLPGIAPLLNMSDQDIMSNLQSSGYTIYEKTPIGSNEKGGFEVIKLPSDVSLEQAGLMYVKGIDNLDPSDAGLLLHGSWSLSVDRSAGVNIRVRYADFNSQSVDAAIQNAKAAQGLADAQAEEAGVDDSGNTFQTGKVESDGESYTWRVSVCPLSDIYSVSGLPENAYYVGIRYLK